MPCAAWTAFGSSFNPVHRWGQNDYTMKSGDDLGHVTERRCHVTLHIWKCYVCHYIDPNGAGRKTSISGIFASSTLASMELSSTCGSNPDASALSGTKWLASFGKALLRGRELAYQHFCIRVLSLGTPIQKSVSIEVIQPVLFTCHENSSCPHQPLQTS